jgi:hypothetical protein
LFFGVLLEKEISMPISVEKFIMDSLPGPQHMKILDQKLKPGLIYTKEEVMKMLKVEMVDDRPYRVFKGVPTKERNKWIIRTNEEVLFARPETVLEYMEKKKGIK